MNAAAFKFQPTEHISVSALNTYLRCPRAHEHRYILKTPPSFRPGNLAFGSAIHSTLALFYALRMRGTEPTLEVLIDDFVDAWNRELDGDVPVLFDGDDTPDEVKDRGVAMLQVFYKKVPRPHRVLFVEKSFRVELHSPDTGEVLPTLIGKIDALVEDADGRRRVLEHKTAAKRFSEMRLTHDLQATAYSLALHEMGIDADVTFQVLMKTKTPALELYEIHRSSQDHRDLLETIHGVQRAIQAEVFYPVRDWWCQGCVYAGPCIAG